VLLDDAADANRIGGEESDSSEHQQRAELEAQVAGGGMLRAEEGAFGRQDQTGERPHRKPLPTDHIRKHEEGEAVSQQKKLCGHPA